MVFFTVTNVQTLHIIAFKWIYQYSELLDQVISDFSCTLKSDSYQMILTGVAKQALFEEYTTWQ